MAMQRHLFRIAIDRAGEVRCGEETVFCTVVDLTEQGVRLRIDGAFSVGQELDLRFAPSGEDVLNCTIQVAHHQPPYVGAVILRMAEQHKARLTAFIDQVNALNMAGF